MAWFKSPSRVRKGEHNALSFMVPKDWRMNIKVIYMTCKLLVQLDNIRV